MTHLGKVAFASVVAEEIKRVVNVEDVNVKNNPFYSDCTWSSDGFVIIGKFYHFFGVGGNLVEIIRLQDTNTWPSWKYLKTWHRYMPKKQQHAIEPIAA